MNNASSDQPSANQAHSKTDSDRLVLQEARAKGAGATLGAFIKLSGPGWLQSAITLGGGSLSGALFLGVLGGSSLLWLQLVAIIMGVVMLSAISYVTLSTGERPFRQINNHINPVLGWGWLIATSMANMIWCMPQFALCYEALQKNLLASPQNGEAIGDSLNSKLLVSGLILAAAGVVVVLNSMHGWAGKIFDWFLKALVGLIVLCFFGVVIRLGLSGYLNGGEIFAGFIPDFSSWTQPSGKIGALVATLPGTWQEYWTAQLVPEQRKVMIGAAATAVGINMTFLLPYSMLSRGWDKSFRGLARFDLSTGMAIPYVLVTSCVVIATASTFHAKVDDAFLSNDPATMKTSPLYSEKTEKLLLARVEAELGSEQFSALSEDEKVQHAANLPETERIVASALIRRNAFQLSAALAPLLGADTAKWVFGIGVLGMGFSSIIILMLINGYAFCEMLGLKQGGAPHVVGCIIAGAFGAAWPLMWDGDAKLWLAILASSFGMMLLPIAYLTFFMMMNSTRILGDAKPKGASMLLWNVLMAVSVAGAGVAAATAIYDKIKDPKVVEVFGQAIRPGYVVLGIAVAYILLVFAGFVLKNTKRQTPADQSPSG